MKIKPVHQASAALASLAPALPTALMRMAFAPFALWVYNILHPHKPPLKVDWYLSAIFQAFQKTATGQTTRLVINVPPRHLKSITSAAFVAWMLGRNPALNFMIATYADRLGRDHLERVKAIMSHPFYLSLFPRTRLKTGGISRGLLSTTTNGGFRSVTVSGSITGFGADYIIIDDSMNAIDINSEAKRAEVHNFYRSALVNRLNDSTGVIISIQQRLGEDDLPGLLLEQGAEHLCLPSYDDTERVYDIGFGRIYRRPIGEVLRPDDQDMNWLNAIRGEQTPRVFATQYLQQPSALEGNLIRLERLSRFDLEEWPRSRWERIAISWDTASSESSRAAYSAGLLFGRHEGKWYLLDVIRERLAPAKLRDRMVAQHRRWRADTLLIEEADVGKYLRDDLRAMAIHPIMMAPVVEKAIRMEGQLAFLEDGNVLFPNEAPWLLEFMHELRAFPTGRTLDQADALAQFCEWAKTPRVRKSADRDPDTRRPMWVVRKDSVHRR